MPVGTLLGKVLTNVAPWLAAAASGPSWLQALALRTAAAALGLPATADGDTVAQAVASSTPEQLEALQAANTQFADQMKLLGFAYETDLIRLGTEENKQIQSVEVQMKSHMPAILASGITVGFFVILLILALGGFKSSEDNSPMLLLLGSLSTAWTGVIGYYFGTTQSSARKDIALVTQSINSSKGQ